MMIKRIIFNNNEKKLNIKKLTINTLKVTYLLGYKLASIMYSNDIRVEGEYRLVLFRKGRDWESRNEYKRLLNGNGEILYHDCDGGYSSLCME